MRTPRHFVAASALWSVCDLACAPVAYELIGDDASSDGSGRAGATSQAGGSSGAEVPGNAGGSSAWITGGTASKPSLDGWSQDNIGTVAEPGEASVENDTVVLKGGLGRQMPADHGNEEDAFFLVSEPWSGDVEVTVQLLSADGECGIMLREGTEPLARYVAAGFRPGKPVSTFQYRSEVGARSPVPLKVRVATPVWLRLVRRGDEFKSYYSFDAADWKSIGGALLLPLHAELRLGLFLAFPERASARFSDLRIVKP